MAGCDLQSVALAGQPVLLGKEPGRTGNDLDQGARLAMKRAYAADRSDTAVMTKSEPACAGA